MRRLTSEIDKKKVQKKITPVLLDPKLNVAPLFI